MRKLLKINSSEAINQAKRSTKRSDLPSIGFTLIELLVVISVIGILVSLALVSYSGAQKQTRDTQRRSDLAQYRNGLENYAASNNGIYPVQASAGVVTNICGAGTELEGFLSDCPDDPMATDRDYYYQSDASGLKYVLYADLEAAGWWYICSSGKIGTNDQTATPAIGSCP